MLNSQKEYKAAMRKMIRYVQSEHFSCQTPPLNSNEDREVLADCIRNGYINGTIHETGKPPALARENRLITGDILPIVYNSVIPLKGLIFLEPDKEERRVRVAFWASLVAVLVSLAALLVSALSNLDRLIDNIRLLISLFS